MRTFRTLAAAVVVSAAMLIAGAGAASADPPPRGPLAGFGAVILAPFWFACWSITGTGSDTPSPQCDAIFDPILKQFQSVGS